MTDHSTAIEGDGSGASSWVDCLPPERSVVGPEPISRAVELDALATAVEEYGTYSLDADGRIAAWNDAVADLTGYRAPAVLGERHARLFADDRVREARLRRLAIERECASVDGWYVRADGERFRARTFLSAVREDGTLRGFVAVVRDVTERRERERALHEERTFAEAVFAAQPDVMYAFDADGASLKWNDRVTEVTGYSDAEIDSMEPLDFIAPEDRDGIAAAIARILDEDERVTAEAHLLTKDGERIPYEFNSARITAEDGTVRGFTGVGRDVSDRKGRERELERLNRLNEAFRAVDGRLDAAETRADVEAAVADVFAETESIRHAAVGTVADGAFDADAWAGPEPRPSTDPDSPGAVLARRATESRTVAARQEVDADPTDAWRTDAEAAGYRSVAAVPLAAEARPFGVLVCFATDPEAFGERERRLLEEFGSTIAHAIVAMEARRLVHADVVTELEFVSTDERDVCIDVARQADCRLTVEHVLPVRDGVFLYYARVSGVSADRVEPVLSAHPAIDEARLVTDRESDADGPESVWECRIVERTFTEVLVEYGAKLRTKTVVDGQCRLVAEGAPTVAVRELVEAVETAFPETDLVGKRTVERPVETGGDFRQTVSAALTEKQRTALEAAYRGGYFEWPTRDRGAGEIADSLGVARQTFHQHLRVATRKLLAAYFDRDGE